jgi:hypothetical protein
VNETNVTSLMFGPLPGANRPLVHITYGDRRSEESLLKAASLAVWNRS